MIFWVVHLDMHDLMDVDALNNINVHKHIPSLEKSSC
jgi:hypothetical protein